MTAIFAACTLAWPTAVIAGPQKASGWYSEAGIGAAILIKPQKTLDIGPSLQLRLGRDLFSWFSVGAALEMSTHASALPAPPDNEYLQIYRGAGHARIGGLIGSVSIYLEGGAGIGRVSSNLLERQKLTTPGQRNSLSIFAGAGAELQLDNRHYALGFAADGWLFTQFESSTMASARLYLRYTY
jgi:hypothetical protein